jgi:hypothetical protein
MARAAVMLACCVVLGGCIGDPPVYEIGPTEIQVHVKRRGVQEVRLACSASFDAFIGLVNGTIGDGNPIQRAALESGSTSFRCGVGVSTRQERSVYLMLEGDSRVYQVQIVGHEARVREGDARVVPAGERADSGMKRPWTKEGFEESRKTYDRHREIYYSAHWKEARDAHASVVQHGALKEPVLILMTIGDA